MDVIIPNDELSVLVHEGASILMNDSRYSDAERRKFCLTLCQGIIKQFDRNLIIQQFCGPNYTNVAFKDALSQAIEVGVIAFMLKYELYETYIDSNNLKKIIAILNYTIAYDMATIFNSYGLRPNTEGPCVYNNEALGILVNRTYQKLEPLIPLKLSTEEVYEWFREEAEKELKRQ